VECQRTPIQQDTLQVRPGCLRIKAVQGPVPYTLGMLSHRAQVKLLLGQ
jgi:hypothetical protein